MNQVKADYSAKDPNMVAYLAKTNSKFNAFSWIEILQIPREKISEANALARLGSGIDEDGFGTVPIEFIPRPSVSRDEVETIEDVSQPTWMDPIIEFL